MESKKEKSKIVLHTCCAVCGAYLCELLKNQFSEVLIYFYNPNIYPKEEYEKRLASVKKLAEVYEMEFVEGEYDDKNWLERVKGLENEPEGGERCPVCFAMRLEKTVQLAKDKGFEYFTTTLAMSPYKDEKITDELGEKIAKELGIHFLKSTELEQEKKEVWNKNRELARKMEFYHQKYCGCQFSIRH
jgi:predicted adenine nucleotide alpha hydrolase (AANH) superfamily ATPase